MLLSSFLPLIPNPHLEDTGTLKHPPLHLPHLPNPHRLLRRTPRSKLTRLTPLDRPLAILHRLSRRVRGGFGGWSNVGIDAALAGTYFQTGGTGGECRRDGRGDCRVVISLDDTIRMPRDSTSLARDGKMHNTPNTILDIPTLMTRTTPPHLPSSLHSPLRFAQSQFQPLSCGSRN